MKHLRILYFVFLLMPAGWVYGQSEYIEVFRETFNPNQLDWPISETKNRITRMNEGRYAFRHVSSDAAALIAREVPILLPENYSIETKVYLTRGDGSDYGLVFNYSDPSNFHMITISNEKGGYYSYGYFLNGVYNEPVPRTATTLKEGEDGNTIKIHFEGGKMRFLVNDRVLKELFKPNELGTKIGFILFGGQEMEVEYLAISEDAQKMTVVQHDEKDSGLSTALTSDYENKVALVVGIGDYPDMPLKNAKNDAIAISRELKNKGFDVRTVINADRAGLRKAIIDFSKDLLASPGVGLFYYAGHGLQANGINYLMPVDADIQAEFEIEDKCVRADRVLRMLNTMDNPMNIIILDACRNNPFASAFRSASKGLAMPETAPTGAILAFATAPGKTASDGDGQNGLYTEELIKAMRIPGLTIEEILKRVRISVYEKSDGQQIPWENSSLMGDFYFIKEN